MTHISVLKNELIDGLSINKGDIVVDGTLGGGGHTKEIIKRYGNSVKIIGLDLDSDAIDRAKEVIKGEDADFIFKVAGFQDIKSTLKDLNINQVDKILLDLGLSSFQIDISGRGFSFQKDEPLYMTMSAPVSGEVDKEKVLTAYEIVNFWQEDSLKDIIYGFGEERYASRIAKAIVFSRLEKEIKTTKDLVGIIEKSVGHLYRKLKIHPATRTFQAIRIAVNSELLNLEKVIDDGYSLLKAGGRIGIISFHSLEDRIVKRKFIKLKEEMGAKIITKKPIVPNEEEIINNPRSRSAKLRIIAASA